MEEKRVHKTNFKNINIPNKNISIENLAEDLDKFYIEAPFNEEDFNIWKKPDLPVRKNNPVNIITKYIIDNFKKSNFNFKYDISMNPKRILTIPEEGI